MRQFLSRCTRPFRIFTLLRSAVWAQGVAGSQVISKPCWCNPRAQRRESLGRWRQLRPLGTMAGQEYLGPRLEHAEAVWVLDGSDFPKQGRKSDGSTVGGARWPTGRNVPGIHQAGAGTGGQAACRRAAGSGRCDCGSAGRKAPVPVKTDGVRDGGAGLGTG